MQKFRMSKKYRKIIVALVFAAGLWYALFWLRRFSAPQLFGEAVLNIETQKKVVALTFDDGPNPEATEKILEILKKNNARATFFVLGENVKKYPGILPKIYGAGNEIGNHSLSHERLTFKSPRFVSQQIEQTDKLIRSSGYKGTIYFRAPFGHKLFVLPYILMKTNRKHILYSIVLDDWDSPPMKTMLDRLDKEIRPGSIILLHDGYFGAHQFRDATVKLVDMIIQKYGKKGYEFVTISGLLSNKR